MTTVITGSTDDILAVLFNLPRYNEHVIAWRWHIFQQGPNLHVTDYYLHKALQELKECRQH